MKSMVLALRCLRKSSFRPMSWRSSTRPSSLVTSSVMAVSMATLLPIDCIVHRGDQVLDIAAVERRDEGAAHRGEHLAGDIVGVIFKLIDALTEYRRLLAAAQHALQRQRALHDRLGVAGKQIEKPLILGEKGAKPTQHLWCPLLWKMTSQGGLSRNCHKPFPGESGRQPPMEPGHPPLCRPEMPRKPVLLERPPEIMRDLADHAAPERQHARHKDRALDQRQPPSDAGQILSHGG